MNTFVKHVFQLPGLQGRCVAADCGVYIRQTNLTTDDLPLCPDCNLRMLNFFSNPAWTVISTPRLSYPALSHAVLTQPIEAYVSPGPTAHYLVIHGVFEYKDRDFRHSFVMLADPEEEGPGFCEYGRFVDHGSYHSTSRYYEWTKTFY